MALAVQYRCGEEGRRRKIEAFQDLNAIDFLEVLDLDADGRPTSTAIRQRTLLVRLFREVPASLLAESLLITGGVRVTPVRVLWALPAPAVASAPVPPAERSELAALLAPLPAPENVLVVRTDSTGDFSTYRLRLVQSRVDLVPPQGFDPLLSEVAFSFKVECPTEFDCKSEEVCPPQRRPDPRIDYLAKDYASFRRLMLDRMSVLVPEWRERNPADLGVALVELLAYSADHLSQYQDAVATEAYLGTARKRVSVRRHARLLDDAVDDGSNARAWVAIRFQPEAGGADGVVLPGFSEADQRPGTQLLTRVEGTGTIVAAEDVPEAVAGGALVFETLHSVALWSAHDEIRFHTWCDERCCLPRGATRATLDDDARRLRLERGDVLIFEEVRGAESGRTSDADPGKRHAVRLTRVEAAVDPVALAGDGSRGRPVLEIEWSAGDALPFPLCLWEVVEPAEDEPGGGLKPVAVARGNVVLADHGRTLPAEPLEPIPRWPELCPNEGPGALPPRPYRPRLAFGPLTFQGRVRTSRGELVLVDRDQPAAAAFRWRGEHVRAAVRLLDAGSEVWRPQRDLLASDRFARELVVEVEDDGGASLRFGDGLSGRLPVDGLEAVYRVGHGKAGNVGSEGIHHLVVDPALHADAEALRGSVVGVRNPLSARGGRDPEALERVRQRAPFAFRTQQRAVTADDYAAVTERHSEVQRAAATLRWTGSWHTVFLTVDRRGGGPVDAAFEADLRAFLERFRMAGHDLEVDAPRFVALDVAMTVCVAPGFYRADVEEALLEALGTADLPDGRRGFFHPDNFTFGQPVYLSQVLEAVMSTPGVRWADVSDSALRRHRFQRWGEAPQGELENGRIDFGRLEIARLDNDPNARENGRLELFMEGGL